MARWKSELNIKEILNDIDDEDDEDIIRGLKEIGEKIQNSEHFKNFAFTNDFLNPSLPKGIFSMQDLANKLLDNLYDYADHNKIWMGI